MDITLSKYPKNDRRRKFVRVFIFIGKLVLAGLLIFLAFRTVRPDDVIAIWGAARLDILVLVLCLGILNIFLQAIRWLLFIRVVLPKTSLEDAVRSLFAGFSLGLATPGRLGEIGRAWYVGGDSSPWILALLSYFDKFCFLLWIYIVGLISVGGILTIVANGANVLAPILFTAGILLVILALYISIKPAILVKVITRCEKKFPKRNLLGRIRLAMQKLSPGFTRRVLCFSALNYLVSIMEFFFALIAFTRFPLFDGLRVIGATWLVKAGLPVTFAGLGVGEVTIVEIIKLLGGDPVAALNASLLIFILNIFIPGLIGIPIVVSKRHRNGKIF